MKKTRVGFSDRLRGELDGRPERRRASERRAGFRLWEKSRKEANKINVKRTMCSKGEKAENDAKLSVLTPSVALNSSAW